MFTRMQALVSAPNGDAERHAMHDAIRVLRVIQVEKLNYPSWPGDKNSDAPHRAASNPLDDDLKANNVEDEGSACG